jgi:anti-anti-sigma regulatory factor
VANVTLVEVEPPIEPGVLHNELKQIISRVKDNKVVLDLRKVNRFGHDESSLLVLESLEFHRQGGRMALVVNQKAADLLKRLGFDQEETLGRTFAELAAAVESFKTPDDSDLTLLGPGDPL